MFLIDGYNLLHAARVDRESLLAKIEGFCRRGGYQARVIFDPTTGMRSRETRGPVEVRCVAVGRKADDEILRALGSTEDRTAHTLVSDDGELVGEAGRRKVRVVPCRAFIALLDQGGDGPPSGEGGVPPGEVDYWMKEFGLED